MNRDIQKILYIVIPLLVLIGFGVWFGVTQKEELPPSQIITNVTNFEECASAGNPIMESYPRKCNSGGQTFTEEIGRESDVNNLIRLTTPKPNQVISSPLIIEGEARGNWFFEASFPVVLTNWDGLIIAQGIATAKGEWMTTDFVPFTAKLEFKNPTYKNNGVLILRKDNPSGLPEYDNALEISIVFRDVDVPATSTTTTVLPSNSGIQGKVSLGPMCPVMRDPPDPNCDDKGYQTNVQIIAVGSPKSSPYATVQTDKDGAYKIMLPPGKYAVQPVGGNTFPYCGMQEVTVKSGVVSVVNVSCDTGIR